MTESDNSNANMIHMILPGALGLLGSVGVYFGAIFLLGWAAISLVLLLIPLVFIAAAIGLGFVEIGSKYKMNYVAAFLAFVSTAILAYLAGSSGDVRMGYAALTKDFAVGKFKEKSIKSIFNDFDAMSIFIIDDQVDLVLIEKSDTDSDKTKAICDKIKSELDKSDGKTRTEMKDIKIEFAIDTISNDKKEVSIVVLKSLLKALKENVSNIYKKFRKDLKKDEGMIIMIDSPGLGNLLKNKENAKKVACSIQLETEFNKAVEPKKKSD